MNSLIYLKELFCKNAMSFKKIDDKTRLLLGIIIFFNVVYIVLNGMKFFSHQHYINSKTLSIIFSAISASAFIYVLKDNLYKTFDFSLSRMKRALVFGNITYFLCFLVYWLYNTIMAITFPVLGGDVQHIKQMVKIDIWQYLTIVLRYICSLLNEELLIVAVFLIVLSLFNKVAVRNVIISSSIALIFFALLHVFSWNFATIPAIMMNKLPAVFLFIFFMDIKPVYIAHLFNNCWVSLTLIQGMTGTIKNLIFVLFAIPMILYLADCTIKYEYKCELPPPKR